jgi:pyruvate dehydrogenase E1 component beta subunit
MNGCRPIVEYMTLFSLVGIDQIINNAAKKVKCRQDNYTNGFVVQLLLGTIRTTHSQAFENWFTNTPGFKVVVPSIYDAKGLLKPQFAITIRLFYGKWQMYVW